MTHRASVPVAVALALGSTTLLMASIPLKFGIASGVPARISTVLTPLAFLLFSIVGSVIVIRTGNHPVGWLFCAAGVGWAFMWFSGVVVERAHFLGETAPDPIVWLASWTEVVGIATSALALYVFPTGRLLSARWRIWVIVTCVAGTLAILGEGFSRGPLEDYPYVTSPYVLGEWVGILRYVGWPLLLFPMVASAVALVVRSRRSKGEERQQLKWMMFAGIVVASFILFWALSAGLTGNDRVAESLQGIGLGMVPTAAGIAILKHRLYDIDVVINRTLVYGLLTAILGAAYAAIVFALQGVLSPVTADSDIAIAASTLVVAALFRPVRIRVQNFIDRRFYRQKFDAQRTIEQFNLHLRDVVELREINERLVGVVGETMQPAHVSLWLRGRA